MFDPVKELQIKMARELAEEKVEREEELKKYPLAQYSIRALKDEIKRRKGYKLR